VYFGIFMVKSLQLRHIARLFLVNVSENMQFLLKKFLFSTHKFSGS
jgi:hypothetical protein